ncbi:hypothetical protein DINM_004311 [Dirofilaria immitis]|nr:hypothetical protein [Dirofilaria immitis]
MDVDEKDEYEIVSEMEKPANFATQRDVENEEPETIGINIHAQENVASLELKRPSRWDVGAPFCIPLNDALASNTNETIVKKCSTGLDGARNGAYNKTINENENEKIFTNETAALKIPGIKIEKYAKNAKTFIATEHEDEIGNHINLSLDKIALPCNPYDIALPPEPSELNDSADCSLLSRISEDKHDSETTSDKEKVIIKWKFTKTPKELLTGDVKIWEPDVERHELSNLHPGKQSKSVLRYAKTSLDTRTASGSLNFDADKGSIHPELLFQRHADHREIGLPPCSLELKSNFHSQNNATLLSTQDQSDYVMHKMKCLENQNVKQNIAPQEASEEANEEQSISNENLRSNWSNISETVLSCSKLQCNHDLGKVTIMDDGSEATKETNVQKTVTSWFATHFSQELHLKETKSSPELISSLQQQWNMDVSKTGTNREDEQDSSPSSASSATSVSMYSFNSTPKTLLSLDLGNLQTTEEQENYSKSVGVINANLTGSANDESLVVEASQPSNYEQLDENIILCDESLIKEAKVVRCFCEPTSEEIAESRGCSSGCINRELYTECGSRCPSGMGCANRRFHNKQYAKVEVFNAGVKGWGLRAAEPLEPYVLPDSFSKHYFCCISSPGDLFFSKLGNTSEYSEIFSGRFIIEYVGEVIDAEEMIRRGRRSETRASLSYGAKERCCDRCNCKGNVSRFINHSCDPNCESQKYRSAMPKLVSFPEMRLLWILRKGDRNNMLKCTTWTVDRQLRVGFFAIKPITLGEEIVFDYQLERYGRKAQRCFCGAANCRGRIGDNSESEEGEEDKASDEVEGSETDDEVPLAKRKLKLEKRKNFHITKKKRRQSSAQRCNKAIINALSRGPPRNRTQVRDLVRLMVQVEQAPQRSSLIQCIRFAHPDVLRLFIQESGSLCLRLLYVFLATDYPIDDEQSVLQLQIKSLDLLDVMPIMNRNQIIDSHLASTVEKIASKKGPVDEIVEDVVRKLVDAACCDMPSTSKYSASTLSKDPDFVIECLHYEMVTKAAKLMGKWSDLREEYRIPRRERTDPVPAQHDISRYVRDDGSTLWRLSGFGPPPKSDALTGAVFPKNKDFKQSPVTTFDSSRINEDDERENRPRKRHSRFDIVGERNPSSIFSKFLYDEHSFPEFFDWNTVYAKYDPSSAAYQQFIDYYQQQQYSMMGMLPCALTPQSLQNAREMTNILEAPSPPPPKQPKTPEENPNMLIIGPIDVENPTDEDIEMLEKHLIMLKGKRAEIRKHLQEVQKGVAQESNDMNSMPPPLHLHKLNNPYGYKLQRRKELFIITIKKQESVWTLPDESEGGNASADTTTDRIDTRATFKVEIVKYVGGMLEPIRKLKFASSDDYKYVLRKLTHTILEKELKRVGETELKVTESVRDKARKFVAEYLARLGDVFISIPLETSIRTSILARLLIPKRSSEQEALRFTLFRNDHLSVVTRRLMNRIKIRRTFPRNRFYIKILLDWKDSVDDRNFRSVLCRALINLRAYPLDIATFADLKNIRGGIGDQIARRLEEAWNVFCSRNLTQKSELNRTMEELPSDSIDFIKSRNVKYFAQRADVENLKPYYNSIGKRRMRTVQPLQLSKKVALENESTCSSSITENEPHCGEVIQRSNSLNVNVMINYAFDDTALINSVADDDGVKQASAPLQEFDVNLIYHPSVFSTSQIILIIDNRESANTRKFQQMCRDFYEMRSLSIGDYLWIMRMCNGAEVVLDSIVERKTFDDLWSSIMQRRYEEQKRRLISTGIPNIIYIFEGSMISEPVLEQALVTTHIENRFLVYRTNDIEHTSLILSQIAERLIKKQLIKRLALPSSIVEKTNCRNVKDVFLRQLVVCPQISVQKASIIVDRFPSFAALRLFYASLPKEQRAEALSEQFLSITKTASANMAKFYSGV